ncbi:hypothetical protein VTO73DRAFT_9057 [Trametes versicolor]
MEVDGETYEVFASIFSIGRDKKGTLAWGDFAMTKLGFTYHSLKGSKRQFRPKSPGPPLPCDEPHGKKKGVITRDVKGRLATKLGRLSALWSRPRQTSLRPPHVVVAPALAGIAFSFAPVLYIHQYLGGDDTTGPAKPLLKLTFHKPALHKLPPAAAEKNTYFIVFKPSHTRVRAAAAAFHGGLRRASICNEVYANVSRGVARTTSLSCGIAVTVLLLYDVVLTSGQEYRYIWRNPKTWMSRTLYVCNSCASLFWLTVVLELLSLAGSATFTTLRIYALSQKNRILSGIALVLSMAPFVINTSTQYQQLPSNLPAPLNCVGINIASRNLEIGWVLSFHRQYPEILTIASRGSLILVESLAIAVTWHQRRATIQLRTGSLKRPSLQQVMWENGAVYFLTLVSINTVDMVFFILSIAILPDENSSYVISFIDPISSILNSRFLLALHETNTRLEGAANTSLSSLTLNTGSSDTPSARASPELPPVLGPIGGTIHAFHDDDDEDMRSLEFAPPELRTESGSELEGDILESGGSDAGNSMA